MKRKWPLLEEEADGFIFLPVSSFSHLREKKKKKKTKNTIMFSDQTQTFFLPSLSFTGWIERESLIVQLQIGSQKYSQVVYLAVILFLKKNCVFPSLSLFLFLRACTKRRFVADFLQNNPGWYKNIPDNKVLHKISITTRKS